MTMLDHQGDPVRLRAMATNRATMTLLDLLLLLEPVLLASRCLGCLTLTDLCLLLVVNFPFPHIIPSLSLLLLHTVLLPNHQCTVTSLPLNNSLPTGLLLLRDTVPILLMTPLHILLLPKAITILPMLPTARILLEKTCTSITLQDGRASTPLRRLMADLTLRGTAPVRPQLLLHLTSLPSNTTSPILAPRVTRIKTTTPASVARKMTLARMTVNILGHHHLPTPKYPIIPPLLTRTARTVLLILTLTPVRHRVMEPWTLHARMIPTGCLPLPREGAVWRSPRC